MSKAKGSVCSSALVTSLWMEACIEGVMGESCPGASCVCTGRDDLLVIDSDVMVTLQW